MLRRTLCLLLSILAASIVHVSGQGWENLSASLPFGTQSTSGSGGTFSNYFSATGIGPASGNGRLFIGIGPGGVYYSDNQGVSWTAANSGLQDSYSGVALKTRSFLNTGTSVIRGGETASWNNHAGSAAFRSVNNGGSWSESTVPETAEFVKLASGGGRLFASSTLSGAHYSTDDGATWTRWSSGLEVPFGLPAVSRAITYNNGKVFIGSDLLGILASTDGGVTWNYSDNGIVLFPQLIYRATVSPLDLLTTPSGILYALTSGESDIDPKSVYRSTDNGGSWKKVSFPSMFVGYNANGLWRMVNNGEDIIVASTVSSGQCWLYRPAFGWYLITTSGYIPNPDAGETQAAVNGGYLFHSTGTNLFRINLATATLTPVPPKITGIAGGGGINIGDSRTLAPTVFGTLPLTYQWYKDGVLLPGETGSNYTFTATSGSDVGTYTLIAANGGGSFTNSASITTVAGTSFGVPDFSFNPGQSVFGTFNGNCSVVCFPSAGFSYALFRQPDGKIIVGGGFNAVGTNPGQVVPSQLTFANSFVRLNADGTLDASFFAGAGPNGGIRAVAGLPDGHLIVSGNFTTFNGLTANHIVRLNADGTVDPSFNTGLGADNEIIAVLPLADGRLLVGGSFEAFDQRSQGRLAVLHADGSLDESFALPSLLNGVVQSITRQSDGKILIGGGSTNVRLDPSNPSQTYAQLIRLNPNLTVDATFHPTSLPSYVNAIGVLPDDRILVGGNATVKLYSPDGVVDNTFNPGTIPGYVWDIKPLGVDRIAIACDQLLIRMTNGTTVTNIDTTASVTYSVVVEPDGRILAAEGGNSGTSLGGVRRFRGMEPVQAIIANPLPVQVAAGGAAAFSVAVRGAGPFTYQWFKGAGSISGATSSVLQLNNVSAGDVASYSCAVTGPGGTLNSSAAALTLLGAPVIVQQPLPLAASLGDSVRFTVSASGVSPITYQWKKNGSPIVGETNAVLVFSALQKTNEASYSVDVTAAGMTVASSSAALTVGYVPGAVDGTWVPSTTQGSGLSIRGLARQADGKILVAANATGNRGVFRLGTNGVYDTSFILTNKEPGQAVAVASDGKILAAFGNSPNLYVTRLQLNGTTDQTFTNVTLSGSPVGFAATTVNEIRELPDGRILVLGNFANANGAARTNIIRLFADGTVDTNFLPQIRGSFVRGSLAGFSRTLPDGKFLVQNVVSSVPGSLYRLDSSGAVEAIYGMTNTTSQVISATYQQDGKLLVALTDNGTNRVMRFNANGSIDGTFASILLYSFTPYAMDIFVQPSGRILLFGNFVRLNSGGTVTALATNWVSGVIALQTNGVPDAAFNRFIGLSGTTSGLELVTHTLALPDGRFLAGGQFGAWNGLALNGLARIFGELREPAFAQQSTTLTFNQGDNFTLNPQPSSYGMATWQWQRNGVNLSGQNGPTLAFNGVTPADNGTYTLIGITPYGTNSISFSVTVLGAPQITAQPAAPAAVVANPFQMSVSAIGVAPLSYQWRKDGGNLAGATFPAYTNANAALADSGNYDVIISNGLGSVTSSVVVVTVTTQPGSLSLSISNNAGAVNQLLREQDGSFLIRFSGTISRYSQAGVFDTSFSNTLRSALGTGNINVMGADDYGRIYVGLTTPSFSIRRFLHNGAADTSYPTNIAPASPNAMTVAPDGTIFIGLNNALAMVKYLPDGTLDSDFSTAARNALNTSIAAMQVLPDGKVLVASSGGVRRLNEDGTLDSTFAGNSLPGVRGFLPLADGRFLTWGTFSGNYTVGGVTATLRCLARILPTGVLDTTFAGPDLNNASFGVYSVSLQDNSRLIVAGSFTTANSVSHPYVVRLSFDGAIDTTFNTGTGPNSTVTATALLGDGRIVIAGGFSMVNNVFRNGLAVLNGDVADLSFTAEPLSIVVDQGQPFSLSGNAVGSSSIAFSWLHDGLAVSSATTYSVASAAPADAGQYQLVASNLSGSRTSTVASVTVLGAPIFVLQPAGTNGYLYKGAAFTTKVQARAPLALQWYKDGSAIATNGTNMNLALTNLLFSSAGNYSLVASNSLGVSTSAVANLSVAILPGSVDLSFDSGAFLQLANGLTMLPDGRFYVGGSYISNATYQSYAVTRMLPDGRRDPTFNQTKTTVAIPRYIIIDPKGRLLCVGSSTLYRLFADGSYDSSFAGTNIVFNFNIQAAAIQADGKILVGGSFTSPKSNLLRLDENGAIDNTFTPAPLGAVYGLLVLSDGSILAGTTFNPNIRLQRFTQTGANYPGFNNVLFSGNSIGMTRLFELPDGKFLVGGTYSQRLLRFLPNGNVDSTFPTPATTAGSYFEMLIEPGGSIIAAGDFTSWNGVPANGLVRLSYDGVVDASFAGGAASPSQVLGIGGQYDGRLILAGNFTSFDSMARSRLAAAFSTPVSLAITNVPQPQTVNLGDTVNFVSAGWSSTGAPLSYQWYRNGGLLAGQTSTTLTLNNVQRTQAGAYSVVVSDGMKSVTSPAAQLTVLAEPIFIVQPVSLTTTQGFAVTLSPQIIGVQPINYRWQRNGVDIPGATSLQYNIASAGSSDAGAYTLIASNLVGATTSAAAYLSVGSLPAGSLDIGFQTNSSAGGPVSVVIGDPARNQVIVAGNFTTWNSVSRARLAWLSSADGTLLGTNGAVINNQVLSGALQPDGGLLIGGFFNQVSSQLHYGIIRLTSAGQVDPSVTNFLSNGNSIYAINANSDGSAYIGGYFQSTGTVRSNFAKLTAAGYLDPNFGASNMANSTIYSIAVQTNDKILIGGDFSDVLGSPRKQLARLNENGTLDLTFTNTAAISSPFTKVSAIGVQSDGRIIIGGNFSQVSGQPRNYIARLNADGSYDSTFTPTLNGFVNTLVVLPDDRIVVGGDFTTVNFLPSQRIVRLNANGTTDTSFNIGSGAGSSVNSIVPQADGSVIIGGSFTTFNGQARYYVARLLGSGQLAPVIAAQPSDIAAPVGGDASFSVAANGFIPLRFQWLFNGSILAGQTNFSLTLANVSTNLAGSYSVVITNAYGSVTSSIAALTISGSVDPYAAWASSNGLNSGNNMPGQDPDGDGIPNAFEFYFGTSPAAPSPGAAPRVTIVNVAGTDYLGVVFSRSKTVSGVTLMTQASSTADFTDALGTQVHSIVDQGNGIERVIIRSNAGMTPHSKQFIRLLLSIP